MTLLFVYGTLRRGERNHAHMRGCEFVAAAATAPVYVKLDLGPYPGLVDAPAGQGESVPGEVFRAPPAALARLDEFEGVPDLFARRPVDVPGRPGCEAYFWAGKR